MSMHEYFIGLLSGTSVDGIDAVVVDFAATPPRLVATHSEPIPDDLRAHILELCSGQPVSLVTLGETDVALGRLFAQAANSLLSKAAIPARDVLAIGSHGQTVMHHPHGACPFTLQIGDPNTIAWLTGISTVADFRRKDMAAGGQGAPLAPLFHQDFFGRQGPDRAVLNIGGIANITLLASSLRQRTLGFDTGPGNVLMDSWIKATRGLARLGAFFEFLDDLARWTDWRQLSAVQMRGADDDAQLDKINHIVNRLTDDIAQPVSMADVAEELGMSESRFSRFFRRATGNNFTDFVNRVRINRACQLLMETDRYITHIAYDVGFNNMANFNRRFLDIKGMTPSEFRRQAQHRFGATAD